MGRGPDHCRSHCPKCRDLALSLPSGVHGDPDPGTQSRIKQVCLLSLPAQPPRIPPCKQPLKAFCSKDKLPGTAPGGARRTPHPFLLIFPPEALSTRGWEAGISTTHIGIPHGPHLFQTSDTEEQGPPLLGGTRAGRRGMSPSS